MHLALLQFYWDQELLSDPAKPLELAWFEFLVGDNLSKFALVCAFVLVFPSKTYLTLRLEQADHPICPESIGF